MITFFSHQLKKIYKITYWPFSKLALQIFGLFVSLEHDSSLCPSRLTVHFAVSLDLVSG